MLSYVGVIWQIDRISEEKIAEAGILKRYENIDFDACCREIARAVKIF